MADYFCTGLSILGLMDGLIDQHMEQLDKKEAKDMIDLFLIEHLQKSFSFEVNIKHCFTFISTEFLPYEIERRVHRYC